MNITDINPYIRYVGKTKINKDTISMGEYATYDHMLLYFFSGNADIKINHEIHHVKRGTLIILKPGSSYSYINLDADVDAGSINFDYTSEFSISNPFRIIPSPYDEFQQSDIVGDIAFEKYDIFNSDIILSDMVTLEEDIAQMIGVFKRREKYYELNLKGRLTFILSSLLDETSELYSTCGKIDIADSIQGFLDENYALDISNEKIGEILNFHPTYINRIIKKKTGLSLREYIISKRIKKAKELIKQSDMLISEIAYIVGFGDARHFSKSFRKKCGMSPEEYKTKWHLYRSP